MVSQKHQKRNKPSLLLGRSVQTAIKRHQPVIIVCCLSVNGDSRLACIHHQHLKHNRLNFKTRYNKRGPNIRNNRQLEMYNKLLLRL